MQLEIKIQMKRRAMYCLWGCLLPLLFAKEYCEERGRCEDTKVGNQHSQQEQSYWCEYCHEECGSREETVQRLHGAVDCRHLRQSHCFLHKQLECAVAQPQSQSAGSHSSHSNDKNRLS